MWLVSVFLSYWLLKNYDLKVTMLLGLFLKSVSLLVFFPQFPQVLIIAGVLFELGVGVLAAFYFPMKWFRS